MKKEVWWLQNRQNLILYMRMHWIRLKCAHKRAMMKRGGIVGPGIAISFKMHKMIQEYDEEGNIIEKEEESPASRFGGVTKRKVMKLLGLSSDSSVEDCEKINEEIEKKNER